MLTLLYMSNFQLHNSEKSPLPTSLSSLAWSYRYRRLGLETGAVRRPPPGIQAQHPAPAPHARHDRSMARNFWRLGRNRRKSLRSLPLDPRPEEMGVNKHVFVEIPKENQWFWRVNSVVMFEAPLRHKGLATFTV